MKGGTTYQPYEVILQEGQPNNGFWILEHGILEVIKGDKIITELRAPGTIFGEMSDILHQPCATTVRAKTESVVMHMAISADKLVTEAPNVARKVIYTLARRLHNTTTKLHNLLPDTDTLSTDNELEILVVDNRPQMVKAVQTSLSKRPFRIENAGNIGLATEKLEQGNYALVILSLNLPNPDAPFDFYRKLLKNPKTRGIPVMATVPPGDKAVKQRGRDAGMDMFVDKQASPRQLESSVLLALKLDPSSVYFNAIDDVVHVILPADSDESDQSLLLTIAQQGATNAAASAIKKAIIDISKLEMPERSWRPVIQHLIDKFNEAKIKAAVFGGSDQGETLNEQAEEGQVIQIFPSEDEALASLSSPPGE